MGTPPTVVQENLNSLIPSVPSTTSPLFAFRKSDSSRPEMKKTLIHSPSSERGENLVGGVSRDYLFSGLLAAADLWPKESVEVINNTRRISEEDKRGRRAPSVGSSIDLDPPTSRFRHINIISEEGFFRPSLGFQAPSLHCSPALHGFEPGPAARTTNTAAVERSRPHHATTTATRTHVSAPSG